MDEFKLNLKTPDLWYRHGMYKSILNVDPRYSCIFAQQFTFYERKKFDI